MRRWSLALALALVLVGCSIPEDSEPRSFEVGSFISDVERLDLGPRGPSDESGGVAVSIFLIRGDRLIETGRSVPNETVEQVVAELLGGPTGEEIETSIRTAISAGTRLRNVVIDGGVATIDLTGTLADILGYEVILAVGQLVVTATQVPGIDRVRLAIDGRLVQVPDDEGIVSREPVSRADYGAILPA